MAALALVSAAGCSRQDSFPASNTAAGGDAPNPGYRAAPQLAGVTLGPDGAVTLAGRAMPSSQVLMVSPAGVSIETTADGSGAWTALLGPVSEPALYRLAAESGGRRVEAEGLVAVLPGVPAVALLRAGAGAEVEDPGKGALKILAVDYDSGGGAVVSGKGRAGAPVRVLVDGQLAIEGAADAGGRFSLSLPKPLAPGIRRLQVLTPQAMSAADITVAEPVPPKDGPYRAVPDPAGWRINWVTPGGGPQTTLLLGPAPAQG